MEHINGMWICENKACKRSLDVDHVVVATTCHVRRFCSMECVVESFHNHMNCIYDESDDVCGEFDIEHDCTKPMESRISMPCFCDIDMNHDGPHVCSMCGRKSPEIMEVQHD